MSNSAIEGLKQGLVDPSVARLAKAWANSYRGFFGFSAKLADGVVLGDFHLPVKMLMDTEGYPTYLSATNDESILLQMLKARNLKRIRIFVDYSNSGPGFISEIHNLSGAKVPFKVSIAVGRYSYGKKTALYVLKDSAATLLQGWGLNVLSEQKTVAISLSLPSAKLEQGYGKGMDLRKLV